MGLSLKDYLAYCAGGGALPSPLSRLELLNAPVTLGEGSTVQTVTYGPLARFDPACFWMPTLADRLAWYAEKRACKETVLHVTISGAYPEADSQYGDIPGRDFTLTDATKVEFIGLFREALTVGGMRGLFVSMAGDGHSFDPEGLTYGWSWLMEHDKEWADLFRANGLEPYVVRITGFDGCFADWTPDQLDQMIVRMRENSPNGYTGTEFPSAFNGLGDDYGPQYFQSGNGQLMDLYLGEYDFPTVIPPTTDPENDIRNRLCSFASENLELDGNPAGTYIKTWFDPFDSRVPYRYPTPRGWMVSRAYEIGEYNWTRKVGHAGWASRDQLMANFDWYRQVGWTNLPPY